MPEYVKCNLCGEDNTKIKYVIDRDMFYPDYLRVTAKVGLGSIQTFNIVECKNWGLIYTNPRLTTNEIKHLYSRNELTGGNWSPVHRTLIARNISKTKLPSPPTARAEDLIKSKIKKIEDIEKYSTKGKILDIGCGNGYFLKAAKNNGWEACGVELSEERYQFCKNQLGLNVLQGRVEDLDFPKGFFDVVTMWDVFEHLEDPSKALKKVNYVLKDDGLFVAYLMDASSLQAKIFGRWWPYIAPATHLYYFTQKTMEKMLTKNGFNLIKSEISGGISFKSFMRHLFWNVVKFTLLFVYKDDNLVTEIMRNTFIKLDLTLPKPEMLKRFKLVDAYLFPRYHDDRLYYARKTSEVS